MGIEREGTLLVDLVEVLKSTAEYRNFGLNEATVGAFLVIPASYLQGTGFWNQGRKIWEDKSGASVSTLFIAYFFFFFVTFAVYGARERSMAMTGNGFLFLTILPVLAGLRK